MGNALFENARGGPHGCFITLPGIHHVSLDVLAVHKIQGNFGHNFVTLSSVNNLLLHQKKWIFLGLLPGSDPFAGVWGLGQEGNSSKCLFAGKFVNKTLKVG